MASSSRPWPWPREYEWTEGPTAMASKLQALALASTAALTIFWHHHQTRGPTTTAKVKLKACLGQLYSDH